jgi:AcrR family transcriptional regulator
MARWEPNARERLVRAALDLFTEQGYDATTVNEIADRAGLTKTTFFRHFPDKREVLFAGQDLRARLLAEAVAAAMADGLRKRGVQEPTASLAAELGIRAFHHAFDQWADPASQRTLTELTRHALGELRVAAAALG